jgi:hypothetical protein
MCTVMDIQQMSTNCVRTNDDGPYILPHIHLHLSLRQSSRPVLSFSFSVFTDNSVFAKILSSETRNLSQKIYEKRQKKNPVAAPRTLSLRGSAPSQVRVKFLAAVVLDKHNHAHSHSPLSRNLVQAEMTRGK